MNTLSTPRLSIWQSYVISDIWDIWFIKIVWYDYRRPPNRFIPQDRYEQIKEIQRTKDKQRLEQLLDPIVASRLYDSMRRKR